MNKLDEIKNNLYTLEKKLLECRELNGNIRKAGYNANSLQKKFGFTKLKN
jgi:hypothetical protein